MSIKALLLIAGATTAFVIYKKNTNNNHSSSALGYVFSRKRKRKCNCSKQIAERVDDIRYKLDEYFTEIFQNVADDEIFNVVMELTTKTQDNE